MNTNRFPMTGIQLAYALGRNESYTGGGVSTHAYYEIRTKLDPARWDVAMQKVIERQAMLRTVLHEDGTQEVLSEVPPYHSDVIDAEQASESEIRSLVEEARKRISHRVFPLGTWPMFGSTFLKLRDSEFLLLFDLDLLVADGSSIPILIHDLLAFYDGEEDTLEPLEITFQDYVRAEEERKTRTRYQKDLQYWQEHLSEIPEAPHPGFLKKADGKPEFRRLRMEVEAPVWSALKEKAAQEKVSPTHLTAAAYAQTLGYWSNQPEFTINCTLSGRHRLKQNTASLIGDFTATMPVLLQSSSFSQQSLCESARYWKKEMMRSYRHAGVDGVQILSMRNRSRGVTEAAVFPYVFTSMLYRGEGMDSVNRIGEEVYSVSQTPQVYLDCQVSESGGSLVVTWDYEIHHFDAEDIRKMFDSFGRLLRSVYEGQAICDILQPDEKDQELWDSFNRTAKAYEVMTLSGLTEAAFRKYGDRCYLQDGTRELSYAEVGKLAAEIAGQLRQNGIGAGDFVGVSAERTAETVVNILGVVLSGAAYIPVDPEHPARRREYILQTGKCRAFLDGAGMHVLESAAWEGSCGAEVTGAETENPKSAQLRYGMRETAWSDGSTQKRMEPDRDTRKTEQPEAGTNPEYGKSRSARSEDMAYVIYTSGSTGKPKGVMIRQDAVCNTIRDIHERFQVTEEDVFIGISSFCFDLSVYDVFGSLYAGARLVLAPDARDISQVADLVRTHQVTVWNTVPAILSLYMDEIDRRKKQQQAWYRQTSGMVRVDADEAALRLVMLSGDWIPLDLPDRVWKEYPDAAIYSLGGATEASIWSIFYPVREVRPEWSSVPYGRPLANQTFYVLDERRNLCPVHVQGELYIGGRGVAAGYQNDAEKTDAAFIDHPLYGRLYRTGDYGMLKPEGWIEFRGRRDQQVKIGGHRIELGEIEAVLKSDSRIRDVVAVMLRNGFGRDTLAAYYAASEHIPDEVLKEQIREQLPDYMIPQKFCRIDAVPLSANGKVDRKLLPEIADGTVDFMAPRNDVEQRMAAIWAEVLDLPEVGVRDNFFELGGDSVSMVRISGRLEGEFGVKIPLKVFLTGSTIEATAVYLSEQLKNTVMMEAPGQAEPLLFEPETLEPMRPEPVAFEAEVENTDSEMEIHPGDPGDPGDAFPLTDVQMAYLVGASESFEMGGVSAHAYYELETDLDVNRLEDALNRVIRHQPMLRNVIVDGGMQRIAGTVPEYRIERLDLRGEPAEIQKQKMEELRNRLSHQRFDPYTWPLFTFQMVFYGENRQRLLIGFDLLIADGTSMRILVQELLESYAHPESRLLPLEYTFRNYISDRQRLEQGRDYQVARTHWQEKIRSMPAAAAVMEDTDVTQTPQFRRLSLQVPKERWLRIRDVVKQHHVSPSAYLCTLFADLLAFWGNQPQHTLNITIFNRYPFHDDVKRMIGDFTSVMLLDTDRTVSDQFWERVAAIQMNMLESMEHSQYEGIQVIRDLARERSLNMAAVMPIVFTSMIFHDEEFAQVEDFGQIAYSVSQTPQVYLDCQVMETGQYLSITWDYVEEKFDRDLIEEMFQRYGRMILDPEQRCALEVSEDELGTLEAYNQTEKEIPGMVLRDLIRPAFDHAPEKTALRREGVSMTYRELDEASDRVAEVLREHHLGAGDYVGVIATRSIRTIVNLVAVVKTGAAYVPVNAEFPESRRAYILEHSGCAASLEEQNVAFLHPAKSGTTLRDVTPEDDAYVIYTSGSTGRPKGVVIQNDAVCNTILDISSRFDIRADDIFVGISSLCFDLSVFDVFGCLYRGATLVLVPDERDLPHIAELVTEEGVTVWNTVPALMELYLEEQQKHARQDGAMLWHSRSSQPVNVVFEEPSLRLVMLSGDWIPTGLPDRIRESFPDCEIYSLGGATEASIWSICYPIRAVDPAWNSIPYGRPLGNQSIHILNYEQKPCPVGVTGEIYIGGRGLAREYQNLPEKTAEAFLEHPVYGRIYRTGDFGRMTPDGLVEFKGRRDSQIKIRGHRVELGEIEQVMNDLDGIVRSVAAIRKTDGAVSGIFACYVPEEKGCVPDAALKEHCEAFLPSYMIPSCFMEVDQIPLTANGKVDRNALPEPELSSETEKAAPGNDIERMLHRMWCEELDVDDPGQLGIDESFFEAGGDSVRAIRIYSRLRENYAITIRDLFEHQTVRSLADFLRTHHQNSEAFIASQIREIRQMYQESLSFRACDYDERAYIRKVQAVMAEKVSAQQNAHRAVFLTGVTGYLGIHVLHEFLEHTDCRLYLLVRGDSREAAMTRLNQKQSFYFGTELRRDERNRIHILNGDLTQAKLGLEEPDYRELLHVDCIVNMAAKVTHFSSYEEMQRQNVVTVEQLIALSEAGGGIPIYHISSSQVCSGSLRDPDCQIVCGECDRIPQQTFDDFYSQTKYEAEQKLLAWRQKGAPVTLIRLGNVVFQSETGRFQENMQENAFYSLLRVMLKMKCVPELKEDVLEFTFVDKAAELICRVVCRGYENCNLHAVNPHHASLEYFAEVLQREGVDLKTVQYDEFLDLLERYCSEHPDEISIRNVIANKNMLTWNKKIQVRFLSTASDTILKEDGFVWPEITDAMIVNMYRYARETGFFA